MIHGTGTDIEYVYVEMVLSKSHKYEVVSGMFQGIKEKEGVTFILLHGKKDVTNIVSLRYYNIMTIEVLHTDHKDMTYLTIKDEDQKAGFLILTNIYKDLLDGAFGKYEDNGIINTKKYTNVPEGCSGSTVIDKDNTNDRSINIQYRDRGVGNFANNTNKVINNSSTNYQTYKKEIVPSIFARTGTKKPTKLALELMQIKIDQINDGNFKCVLPKTPEDPLEDEPDVVNAYEENNLHWA